MSSLNPCFTVGFQIMEALKEHLDMGKSERKARAAELLRLVGIPSPEQRLKAFPHQLSGGMSQRVMIAMAIACNPKLLIADEPTTALDVTIQAQILDLLRDLQAEFGMAVMLITHDLGVIAEMADHVAVMYAGRVVEQAPVRQLFDAPAHPYTQGLLASIPTLETPRTDRLTVIRGSVPNLANLPPGCAFASRCPHVLAKCRTAIPDLTELPDQSGGVHLARCWLHAGD